MPIVASKVESIESLLKPHRSPLAAIRESLQPGRDSLARRQGLADPDPVAHAGRPDDSPAVGPHPIHDEVLHTVSGL